MSDKKMFNFYEIGKEGTPLYDIPTETIERRGYKKAVKSFQNKYPKYKWVVVEWMKDNKLLEKRQKLPLGRKKKLEG